jgi:PIN domain nuclease of toxin-antitoxin system
MAKYIIDTHSLVWFLSEPSKLRIEQRKAFRDISAGYYIPTRVFEEIRYKFEKFKKDGKNKGAIKVPAIVAWRIAKKCNNIKIIRLDDKEINKWVRKKPQLKQIKRDDLAFAVLQLVLQERYPRTEVRIISNDEIIRKHPLTKTI